MSNDGRTERSARFFAERFPEIAARLGRNGAVQSSVVVNGGAAIDIRIDEHCVYNGDSPGFAAAQVDAYLAKPLRLYMASPDRAGLVSPICIRLVATLEQHLQHENLADIALYPNDGPSFLVVFGLGLGHHLDALARRTGARWLILVEPMVEFFEHSFQAIDWAELAAVFERRGGGVHIVTALDPGAIVAAVARIMTAHGIAFADGSWVFTHYPLWAFAEARRGLHEALEFAFVNRGFFEDELRMVENAVRNFAGRRFALLEGRPRLRRTETAVIVGAGPSLDESIETLHRIRDRVVLFSCGTALRPLLRNGLVPDFHCELENVPEVLEVVQAASTCGDLSAITLVASATVDPGVPPLFGDTIFYFRDTVSSTVILGRKHHVVPATSPTCVTMGTAMAAFMGFTTFVMFGTDCGVRPGARRHAEGTVYDEIGVYQDKDRHSKNTIEVEGNFGGVVQTDWVYDACRLMLAGAIAHYRLDVTNCSDGAHIPGATACVPEALEIAAPPVDRARFAADLRRTLGHFAPGALLEETDLNAVRDGAVRLFCAIDEELAGLESGDDDFAETYRRIMTMIGHFGDRFAHVDSMVDGALHALPRIGMFYGFRIADPAARARLHRVFLAAFRAMVAEMAERVDGLLAAMAVLAPPVRRVSEPGTGR